VVFKDLQKLVVHSQQEDARKELFQRLQGKPFWIWNIAEHKREDIKTSGIRTAVDNDGTLDKKSTSYNGIFDAFRLALKFYHFEDSR
jgi:hypothetical protein